MKITFFVSFILVAVALSGGPPEMEAINVDKSSPSQSEVEVIAIVGDKMFLKEAANMFFRFGAALEFCNANGLTMATVENQAEQTALELNFNQTALDTILWLGGWDMGHEGNFTWFQEGHDVTFSNFAEGQPSQGVFGSCMFMDTRSGTWFDTHCEFTFVPFCQRKLFMQQ